MLSSDSQTHVFAKISKGGKIDSCLGVAIFNTVEEYKDLILAMCISSRAGNEPSQSLKFYTEKI